MKKLIYILMFSAALFSCKKEKPIILDFDNKPEPVVYTDDMRFAFVDRTTCGIYNLGTQTLEWSWTSTDSPQLNGYKNYFSTLDEVKPVNNCEDLLICSVAGGVALIHIADKSCKFFALPMGQPHSIELLPDGNIVVACSVATDGEGNLLKVYKVDPEKPFVEKYVSCIENYGGHNVVWDNYNDVLWATANDEIRIYAYSKKELKLKLYESIKLPQANAHELFPVYGEQKMWLTTSGNIYKFDIYSYECTKIAGRKTTNIKCVSSGPKGFPTLIISPKVSYYTDTICDMTGVDHYHVEEAEFYKARWMLDNPFSYPTDK